jgi:hypothetical protein
MDLEPVEWASTEAPLLVPKKVELSKQEKREIEADLEKLAERLTVTLSAACSKKKKRR